MCFEEGASCLATNISDKITLFENAIFDYLHDTMVPDFAHGLDVVAGDTIDGWRHFQRARDSDRSI